MEPLKGGKFGPALKRWFATNGWPQSITQDWAEAAQSSNGPWASQISKAMNGKAEPKPEFFLALAAFNEAVTERKVQGFTDRRLVDRMISGKPICHDNGEPYDAPAFFSLYVGLIEPPDFPEPEIDYSITQEDLDAWHQRIRDGFKKVAIANMVDKPGAWALVKEQMVANDGGLTVSAEDLSWCQEILSGFRDATPEEAESVFKRWGPEEPLTKAMESLLGKPCRTGAKRKKRSAAQLYYERSAKPLINYAPVA